LTHFLINGVQHFFNQACLKVMSDISQSSTGIADHAVANAMCALDNTRLAVAETNAEKTGLATWINKFYKPSGAVSKNLPNNSASCDH
jgi:hypothetical protein